MSGPSLMTAPLTPKESAQPLTPVATKGAARFEKGQRNWWDDVDILARVRRVHSLTQEGLFASKIASMLKVHERTVHEDRARYLELAREDIKRDVKDHIADLERVIEEAYAAFHSISSSSTFGIKRSDYLNIIRQAKMDIAKLDGSLNPEQPLQVGIQVNFGPPPNELHEQGKLADADYESHLRVLALQAGAEVIEGELMEPATEVGSAPIAESAVARPRRQAPSPPPKAGAASEAAPVNSDPLLAEFVPDPIEDEDEEEE